MISTLAVLLKESWTLVEDQADDLANYLYARLFRTDPNLRELFPVELTGQRAHLLETLVTAMQSIDDPERFTAIFHGLGRAHRRFHVSAEHHHLVGAALLEALRVYGGERWSIEYDQAWRDAYAAMAAAMTEAAARDADQPPYWHAEVVRHERRGADLAVITCQPLAPLPFQAGQYISVECRHQPRAWRTYSIANAPRRDGSIDLHVRARPAGWVSAALVRRLQVGEMVRLGPPTGTMTLDRASARDVVCVAGGVGLAPIKAIVEEIARYNRTRWVHLFVGARTMRDFYDLAALRRLADRHPWLSLVLACDTASRHLDETPGGASVGSELAVELGPVDAVVERYGPWPKHDVYVSGSAPMVRATLGSLARLGVPQLRVRYDALTAAEPPARGRTRRALSLTPHDIP
jgi:NAD(P)H-flavin reductase/hemoglobin-like flavoprotein